MTDLTLPKTIQSILDTNGTLDSIFSALLPALGKVLQCDRCFLYVRNPQTKFGKVAYCWKQNDQIPDLTYTEWQLEPAWLPQEDPLFAAALRAEPSIYIEDVETASPQHPQQRVGVQKLWTSGVNSWSLVPRRSTLGNLRALCIRSSANLVRF